MNIPYTQLLYSKTGVYRGVHDFLIFALKIDCGYSLGGSNVNPRSMFLAKIRKKSPFTSDNNHFYSHEILKYIARTCLRNEITTMKPRALIGIH